MTDRTTPIPLIHLASDGYTLDMVTGGFADQYGVEPVVTMACRGAADEAWHLWHPDNFNEVEAMPTWSLLTRD